MAGERSGQSGGVIHHWQHDTVSCTLRPEKMRCIGKYAMIVFILFLPVVPTVATQEAEIPYVVVVHPSNTSAGISRQDLKDIYLGRKKRWTDGREIVPVTLQGGRAHRLFIEENTGRVPEKFSAFWTQQLYSGRGTPPRSFSIEEQVLIFILSNPGAIGYVSPAADVNIVKVLPIRD